MQWFIGNSGMNRLKDFAGKYCAAQNGTVLPLFGLALFAILGATGLAVDYGRAQMVQSKLHSAIDAAALAAGAMSFTRDVDKEVRKFAEANFPQGYMNTTYTIDKVTVSSTGTIDVTVKGVVDTSFMSIFGKNKIEVIAYSQVARGTPRGLEMVMVLDNSYSMIQKSNGISRRDALVNAAKETVTELYKHYDNNKLYIGMVPFNHYVNVGDAKKSGSKWVRANKNSSIALADPVSCLKDSEPQRPVKYSLGVTPPTDGDTLFNKNQIYCDQPSAFAAPGPMAGMRNNAAELITDIDKTNASGNTRVDLGVLWGWRMLDPSWRGKWDHANDNLPLNYLSKDMDKAMIILTDGYNQPHVLPNPAHADWTGVSDPINNPTANDRLAALCTSLKAPNRGVFVYTIVFQEKDPGINALMKACATTPDHYFYVGADQSIKDVFNTIAESLVSLRLSQ